MSLVTAITSEPPTQPLPSDVLELIISFVPLLPRLRVCSFVCKRWRATALNSIRALEHYQVSNAFACLLPRLSALTFTTVTPPGLLRSVSSLTRLHIRIHRASAAPALANIDFRGLLSKVSSLRHLALSVDEAEGWVCGLAQANAAELESLRLESINRATTPLTGVLALRFPRLRRLKIEGDIFRLLPEAVTAFVRQHAHQLEVLSSFFGFVSPSILRMLLSGDFPKLRKLDICCAVSNDPLLLHVMTSLPPTVTRVALDLSSESRHALDLIRAAGARLYRLTLAGSEIEASDLEAALRPCIRLQSVAMELAMCLAAAAAGCPIRQVFDCNIEFKHLRALTSLHQASPADALAHTEQLPPSLPHLRSLNTAIERTADAVPLLRRLLHVAPRLDSLRIDLTQEWHADHVAVLHEMCALADGKLSALRLSLRVREDVAEALRPQFRAYWWLCVSIQASL